MTDAEQALLLHDSCSWQPGVTWHSLGLSIADDCCAILVWYMCDACGKKLSVRYAPIEVTVLAC